MRIVNDILEMLNEMSYKEAKDLLELDKFDGDVDKAYRAAAMKYHPDKGGSIEMMQKVNAAKEMLGSGKSIYGFDKNKYGDEIDKIKKEQFKKEMEANRAKYEADLKIRIEIINNKLDSFVADFNNSIANFNAHFAPFFNLAAPIIKVRKEVYSKNSSPWPTGTAMIIWPSDDGKTEVRLTAYITSRDGSNKIMLDGPASPETEYSIDYTTSVYHNRKESRMNKSVYGIKASNTDMLIPEKIFPIKKVAKIYQKGKEEKPIARKDAIKFMQVELNGKWDGEAVYIPLDSDKYTEATKFFKLYRGVFQKGFAYWQNSGIWEKKGLGYFMTQMAFGSFHESHKGFNNLTKFIDMLKQGTKLPSSSAEFDKLFPEEKE